MVIIGDRSSNRPDQRRHFVPRFEHLTTINTFNEQALKDNFSPVDRHIRWRNPQHRTMTAVTMVSSMVRNAPAARRTLPDPHQTFGQFPPAMMSCRLFRDVDARVTPILRASLSRR